MTVENESENSPSLVPRSSQERILELETALDINERINKIENSSGIGKRLEPWWRRSVAIVPLIVAIISSLNPAGIAISGYYNNLREEQRRIIDQQNSIRQTYLDRIFKGQLNTRQEEQIFRLLSKLGSDPAFQQWAKEETEVRTRDIVAYSNVIKDATRKIDSLVFLTKKHGQYNNTQTELAKNRLKLREAANKLGDPIPQELFKSYKHPYTLIIHKDIQEVQFNLNLETQQGKPYKIDSPIFHCINWENDQKIRTANDRGRIKLSVGTYITVVEGANLYAKQKILTYESGGILYVTFTLIDKSP